MDLENVWHVSPTDENHKLNGWLNPFAGIYVCPCECQPRIEYEGEAVVVVHNSFDGREGIEWVDEILNEE